MATPASGAALVRRRQAFGSPAAAARCDSWGGPAILLRTFFCPQPVGAVRAGGVRGDGTCPRGVPRGLHMSTRLHPPTCPQVVQIGVHTGVGRRPLRLPNVLLSCRRARKVSV